MPPGLILYCRIRNLKSGLRPETIGADKDFKDLRAFKDFSDGGDRREWLRCSMGAYRDAWVDKRLEDTLWRG